MSSLEALLSVDASPDSRAAREAIELFVARALSDAGVWPSPRTSDGIHSYRIVEQGPACLRACG